MRNKVIFVSYRRDDTGPFALALRSELDLRLQGVPTFVDVNRIQGGDAWSDVLEDALTKSRLVVALIGNAWTGAREDGSQRIADEQDWVGREVAFALERGILLPVLVNGASFPAALPPHLATLTSVQAMPLRTQSWEADLRLLCDTLGARFDIPLRSAKQMMPTPSAIKRKIASILDGELDTLIDGVLQGWRVEAVHDVAATGAVREFLTKKFLFQRDADAFRFIGKVGDLTKKLKHHPIIEAKYADVTMRLSTWDAGHRITTFDVRLAQELDKLAKRWPQRSSHA